MGHHLVVLKVKLTQLEQVIGEGLALGKMLLERAQAAVHGVASGVDDFGIGQDRLDKPGVGEVVGHFIREAGRACPMSLGLLQVLLPQCPQPLRTQVGHAVGESYAGIGLGEVLGDHGNIGQFAGAIHHRVARQNLFQQG